MTLSRKLTLFISALVVAGGSGIHAWQSRQQAADAAAAAQRAGEQAVRARARLAELQQRTTKVSAALQQVRSAQPEPPPAPPPPMPPTKEEMDRARAEAIARVLAMMRVTHFVNDERFLRPKLEQLGLSAAGWESYKALRIALLDAQEKARSRGLSGADLQQALAAAEAEFQSGVRQLTGEASYAELQAFQQRLQQADQPAGIAVRDLTAALVYSETPLDSTQVTQLRALVHAHTSAQTGPFGSNAPALPAEAIEQARAFLSPAQMKAWEQLQGTYRLHRDLNELVRAGPPRSQRTAGTP